MDENKLRKILVTGASVAVGVGLRSLMKKGWENKYNEEPPGTKPTENIDWGKMFLWTVLTGLLLRMVTTGIKRTLSVAIDNNNLLNKA